MKKYFRPEIKVRVLESESLLAGSGGLTEDGNGGFSQTVDPNNPPKSIDNPGSILSKPNSIWDDEEE